MQKCNIPKLLTNNILHEISKFETGKVYSVEEYFQEGTVSSTSCSVLLKGGQKKIIEVVWEPPGNISCSCRGRQVTFWQEWKSLYFLLSFLNISKKVASSNENFVIFGANCEESSSVVKRFVQFLCQEIAGKSFDIEGIKVSVKFE